MKITIDSIIQIDDTYRKLSNYKPEVSLEQIDMTKEHDFPPEHMMGFAVSSSMYFPWKFKHIRDIGDNIIKKRPGRINQFVSSGIDGIETFIDLYRLSNSYTMRFEFMMLRSQIRNVEVDADEITLYKLITPLIIFAMTRGRQVQYKHCFSIDSNTDTICVIIDEKKLEEMNAICDYFGYELYDKAYVRTYVASHPELIEITYALSKIPGISS